MDLGTPVDWSAVPGPVWYRPEAAARAVEQLAASKTPDGAALAIGRLYDAVCVDGAGTLWPAAVPAVGLLLKVVRDWPGKPRIEALDVLLDWWGCFQAAPGYATYQDADGHPVELIPAIERQVRDRADVLRALADDHSDGSPARKKAKDLLALLDAGNWPGPFTDG